MRCKAIRFVMSVSPTELSSGLPLSFYPNEREDIPRKFPLFFGATPFFWENSVFNMPFRYVIQIGLCTARANTM